MCFDVRMCVLGVREYMCLCLACALHFCKEVTDVSTTGMTATLHPAITALSGARAHTLTHMRTKHTGKCTAWHRRRTFIITLSTKCVTSLGCTSLGTKPSPSLPSGLAPPLLLLLLEGLLLALAAEAPAALPCMQHAALAAECTGRRAARWGPCRVVGVRSAFVFRRTAEALP